MLSFSQVRKLSYDKLKKEFCLSDREMDVVRLVCQGLSNRAIAEKLFISEYTVKDHIKKIMAKMKVASRNEMVAVLK